MIPIKTLATNPTTVAIVVLTLVVSYLMTLLYAKSVLAYFLVLALAIIFCLRSPHDCWLSLASYWVKRHILVNKLGLSRKAPITE